MHSPKKISHLWAQQTQITFFADYNLHFAGVDETSQSFPLSEQPVIDTWVGEAAAPYGSQSENVLYNMNARLIRIEEVLLQLEGSANQLQAQAEQASMQMTRVLDLVQCLRRGMAAFTKSLAGALQPFYHWTEGKQTDFQSHSDD